VENDIKSNNQYGLGGLGNLKVQGVTVINLATTRLSTAGRRVSLNPESWDGG